MERVWFHNWFVIETARTLLYVPNCCASGSSVLARLCPTAEPFIFNRKGKGFRRNAKQQASLVSEVACDRYLLTLAQDLGDHFIGELHPLQQFLKAGFLTEGGRN
jgi:hypothetical protein